MMHYRKGQNVETEMKKEDLHFEDCMPNGQKDFLWMHVKGGTKVNNVVTFAKNALDKGEYRTIIWTGAGGGLVKVISCAEIIKRTHPLYQVTRMCYTNIEEHWLPQMEGLDEIIVNRQIPCLHILMSLDEIDESVSSLQKPNTKTKFFDRPDAPITTNRREYGRRGRGDGQQQQQRNQNRRGEQRDARSSENPPKQERNRYDRRGDNQRKTETQDKQRTKNNTSGNKQQERQTKSPKSKEKEDKQQETKNEPMET